MFLPYLMGERSPVWDGKASGAFVGLDALPSARAPVSRRARRREPSRCATTSKPACAAAAALDAALIVVGGAAHSDLWMQIIADVTGRPVLTIEEGGRGGDGRRTARGAMASDSPRAEDVRRGWVTLQPRAQRRGPRRSAVYDALFETTRRFIRRSSRRCTTLHDQARASA